ncbi:tRNA (cytidine(34)-2'-O)-methyltransferase [Anaerotalea alkaliphila]|uniref:Putative tRNA (cytidine(34)-2'-O)-methyltransferase n=1 Tax=Anaerotalea alkaliphila TaxID=2662126 RepID=A0A7X5HUA8_9FIRM|nr:tRNA (cytidine(34)-2'-O)-methyltransferase [Anaerotalea alkaliphila]NDL66759.1 tRNA (cytidine(34)-2'-O)-methyltransferase [Anaerotalea alkaliphila]
MHIVLLEPEIPQNTGNIGRTCVATGSSLHLIKPLGFSLDEKSLKRSGLDYWKLLDLHVYEDFNDFLSRNPQARIHMATTKATNTYADVAYRESDFLMFGRESSGIPEEILLGNKENCIRIPMLPSIRSLNLSNAVSIVVYEALRQTGFAALQKEGELHHHHW